MVTGSAGAEPALLHSRLDRAVVLLLFAGTLAYLSQLPRILGPSDEGLYLYNSKRILEGDVIYRDIYDIITPASHYVMALAFLLFGTSIVTARAVIAVVHGFAVIVAYATCRTLGVRRAVAVPAALGYLALCQPAFPYASPHWISTCLCLLLLFLLVHRGGVRDRSRAILLGVAVGALIAVQHQRGAGMAITVVAVLLLQHFVDRRFGLAPPLGTLAWRIAQFAAAVALVVLPMLVAMLTAAGFQPVYRALVEHPLITYRATMRSPWGYVSLLTAQLAAFTAPRLLKFLPVVLVLPLARAVVGWVRRADPADVRSVATLSAFGAFSALSITYFPDFIHIALIAPVLLITVAESLEWLLRRLPHTGKLPARAGAVVGSALLAAVGAQLYRNHRLGWWAFSVPLETRFGEVDFTSKSRELDLVRKAEDLLAEIPSRQMFVYPGYASLYLMTGANNPTPYPLLIPRYNFDDQLVDATRILEAKKVPLVFLYRPVMSDTDLVFRYVREHYEPVDEQQFFWKRRDGG